MKNDDIIELDLRQLVLALWKKIWLIGIATLICGLAAFFVTKCVITPMYSADVKIYVNNSSISLGSTQVSISSSELSTAQSLVSTYIVILESRSLLDEVISQAELPYTTTQLSNMITASAINSTEIFQITVINPDPDIAELIANTIADVLPDKISTIVDGSSVRVVDLAIEPVAPYSPSYTQNIVLGLLLGFILSCMFVVLVTIFDETISSEDILTQEFDIPILAVIPKVTEGSNKDGYGYGEGYYKKSSRGGAAT